MLNRMARNVLLILLFAALLGGVAFFGLSASRLQERVAELERQGRSVPPMPDPHLLAKAQETAISNQELLKHAKTPEYQDTNARLQREQVAKFLKTKLPNVWKALSAEQQELLTFRLVEEIDDLLAEDDF
jgi:hypothetical protein